MTIVHASAVGIDGTAVLLSGPSGAGKSDLALRLIDGGAGLIADDQVVLSVRDGSLIASAPPEIAGQLEVRGVGLLTFPTIPQLAVGLAVDLTPHREIVRLPSEQRCDFLGVPVPMIRISGMEASAAAKVRSAVRALADKSFRCGAFGEQSA